MDLGAGLSDLSHTSATYWQSDLGKFTYTLCALMPWMLNKYNNIAVFI